MGLLDEPIADRLLAPVAEDARFVRTPAGWCLRAVGNEERAPADIELSSPCLVVFAPARVPGASSRVLPPGAEPRYSLALAGAAEVQRAAALGVRVPDGPAVALLGAARRLRGYRGPADPLRLAGSLRTPHVEAEGLDGMAGVVAAIWERLRDELALEDVAWLSDLEGLLRERLESADFSGKEFGPADLAGLAEGPGVYAFRDARGAVLYVGQSSCLRARVGSYFAGPPRDEKDRAIRRSAVRLQTRALDSALDALIEELRWIRRLRPALNTRRDVRGAAAPGDGVLVVPRTGATPGAVLFAIAGGALGSRHPVSGTGARARQAARKAAATLFGSWREAAGAREAALLQTWRRVHPEATFVERDDVAGPDAAAEALMRAIRALDDG
ncbi:MAG: nucleotide excision repair endonuclease [Acidobacteria bacterium]|nr:nucleotide excision repair endonuclease [Acidobacteriota bacterium]